MTPGGWPDAARETVEWALAVHFSGDRMPHMSGDPRNRLSPGRRRAMEDARDAVLDALTPILAARVEAASAGWMDVAAQHLRNEEWMRGLLERIGNLFGDAARTRDDGTLADSVLLLRVPELVERLHADSAAHEAGRREGIEAAAAVASKRAASRHSTVAHCHSDRSKKHMQIRADEAGQLVADIRALLEGER